MRSLDQDTARLLRAVAQPWRQRSETIAALVARTDHWEQTIDSAREHGVIPSLYACLAANPRSVPAEALQLVKNEFERNAFHCFTNAAELLGIFGAFDEIGIAAMPFKGVVLAASVYGDITARAAGDLDLLIRYPDLARATALLQRRGYELKSAVREDGSPAVANCYEYHFERSDDGMVLELRWRLELTPSRYRENLGLDWAWQQRRTVKLSGGDVPNLDAVSMLLVLCMHGSKHEWSRLIWICDVAKLLESEPELDWEFAQKEAKRVGLWRSLALGVLLARMVAGAKVPQEVVQGFEANTTIRNLAAHLDRNLLEGSGSLPVRRIPYNIRILDFRDRLRAFLVPTLLLPNDQDRAVVRLPKALDPLYYVIRPFRLLLDRRGR